MKFSTGLVDTVQVRVELDDDGDVVVWANDCKLLWIMCKGHVVLTDTYGEQLEMLGFEVNNSGEVVIV